VINWDRSYRTCEEKSRIKVERGRESEAERERERERGRAGEAPLMLLVCHHPAP